MHSNTYFKQTIDLSFTIDDKGGVGRGPHNAINAMNGGNMIKGNIQTLDVIAHPATICKRFGAAIAFRAFYCALSPYSYTFLDVVGSHSIKDLAKRKIAAFPHNVH